MTAVEATVRPRLEERPARTLGREAATQLRKLESLGDRYALAIFWQAVEATRRCATAEKPS